MAETKGAAYTVVELPDKDLAYSNRVYVSEGAFGNDQYVKVASELRNETHIFRVRADPRVKPGEVAMSNLQRGVFLIHLEVGDVVQLSLVDERPREAGLVRIVFRPMAEFGMDVVPKDLSGFLVQTFKGDVVENGTKLASRSYQKRVLVYRVDRMRTEDGKSELYSGVITEKTKFDLVVEPGYTKYVKVSDQPPEQREEVKTEASKQHPESIKVCVNDEVIKLATNLARMDIIDELAKLVTTHRNIVSDLIKADLANGLLRAGQLQPGAKLDYHEPYKSALEAIEIRIKEIRKQGL